MELLIHFLADLQAADDVVVEAPGGRAVYRVASTAVVKFDDAHVLRDEGADRVRPPRNESR